MAAAIPRSTMEASMRNAARTLTGSALVLALLALPACASGVREAGAGDASAVPASPPDHVPDDLTMHVDSASGIVRDIVVVQFRAGTPVDVKAAVVDRVSGRVVGGYPSPPGSPLEGSYIIRIPDTGFVQGAQDAVATLSAQPSVLHARVFEAGE
jgi:hypothetical protein